MSWVFDGVVLASGSPRRQELLTQIGVAFKLATHTVDEASKPSESAHDYVQRLAVEKAQSVVSQAAHDWPVLGADTAVTIDGQILGKPVDKADAMRMWDLLSGREQIVFSSVAICTAQESAVLVSQSRVRFREITQQEREAYWRSEEPIGKAGAYAIQGLGGLFVTRIEGSYSGIVGLPLHETAVLLERFGIKTGLAT
ncbi:MAG: Maf family protein [Pseudohongiellaceae bacterium]|nr:Maf family protein [Pseudohongiellaceae bacterium]